MKEKMQLFIKVPREHIQSAGIFARNVYLNNVLLIKCDAEIAPTAITTSSPPLATKLDIVTTNHEFLPDHQLRLTVDFHLELTWTSTESGNIDNNALGHFSFRYVLDYTLPTREMPNEIRENCLPYFVELNGPYHAWPYIRAELQRLTAAMGLQSVILPVLLIVSNDDEHILERGDQSDRDAQPAKKKQSAKGMMTKKTVTKKERQKIKKD